MATLEEGIVSRAKAQVSGISSRIYPYPAPLVTTAPYITYRRVSTTRYPTLTEAGSYEVAIEFDVIGSSYSNMQTIRAALKAAFEDVLGAYSSGAPYVQRVEVLNEFDGYDGQTEQYTGMLELSFFHN